MLGCMSGPAKLNFKAFQRVRCIPQLIRTSRHGSIGGYRYVPPCQVTNTGDEVYKQTGEEHPDRTEVMEVDDELVYDPELGPLSKRVTRQYFDAIASDEVDIKETAFWFSPPPIDEGGNDTGWLSRTYKFEPPPEAEVEFPEAYHPGEGKIAWVDLEEGQDFEGVITDVWLYHGAEIEFGCEFRGLIPIFEEEWLDGVNLVLEPGMTIKVRIHKLRYPMLYRWPVQLVILEPDIQEFCVPPDDYDCPIDHAWAADMGLSMEDICYLTGRTYEPTPYFIPFNDDAWAKSAQAYLGQDDDQFQPPPTLQERLEAEEDFYERVLGTMAQMDGASQAPGQ